MSTGVRVPISEARFVADQLLARFTSAVQRIEVAGSIRRGRQDVGDIEIVAIPIIRTEPDGFFGERRTNLLTVALDEMVATGMLQSHPTDPKRGERYSKLMHPSGLQLDLFSTTAESWGLIYLIRTGPADYSRQFVTDLRKRALHASEGQLHRGSMGCGSYVCEVVPTPNEEDVYAAARWPFVAPHLRA
jgi:DNA polymerase/3'-5' exonuclease PolX